MGDALGEGTPAELPVHTVTLNAFYLDDTEVTLTRWEKAARGGTKDKHFPWADVETIAHSQTNYISRTNDAFDVINPRRPDQGSVEHGAAAAGTGPVISAVCPPATTPPPTTPTTASASAPPATPNKPFTAKMLRPEPPGT